MNASNYNNDSRTSKYHLVDILKSKETDLFGLMASLEKGTKKATYDEIQSVKKQISDVASNYNPIEEKVYEMNGRTIVNAPLGNEFDEYIVSLPKNPKNSKMILKDKVLSNLLSFIRKEVTHTNRNNDKTNHYDIYRLGSLKSSPRKIVEDTLVAVIGRNGFMMTIVAIKNNYHRQIFIFNGCEIL